MEFSWQEFWSGLLFPTPGYLPDSGAEPATLMSPALAGGFFTTSATWEANLLSCGCFLTCKTGTHLSGSLARLNKYMQNTQISAWQILKCYYIHYY